MKSPTYSPILLYPCGHTFCAKVCTNRIINGDLLVLRLGQCLEIHTVTNRKKTCPYCRQRIVSQALNLSLQKLINNFVALQKNPAPAHQSFDPGAQSQYGEKLRQAETRSRILQCALANSVEAKAKLARDIADAQRKVVQLESREQETKVRLEKVNLEYHRVLSEMRENQDNLATLQKYQDEETAKVNLIQETLKNLRKEYLLMEDAVAPQAQASPPLPPQVLVLIKEESLHHENERSPKESAESSSPVVVIITVQEQQPSCSYDSSKPQEIATAASSAQQQHNHELVCRVCQLGSPEVRGELMELACVCKDDLAVAHRRCAEAWFQIRGNRRCEICGKIVTNITVKRGMWSRVTRIINPEVEPSRHPHCNVLVTLFTMAILLPLFVRLAIYR
ncbi:hypothetical protein SELMODRAFT_447659 [Selaginella moellendorffii]|uniref:RING-CH-type domain-containing protein n=1 Tax=Selaginella moellendorffii TaxID=88036 RepID=D8T1B3_SELML|nr:hypothetical protein SELMODRAFT_447659 [Selaginella moellendorffii]